MKLIIIITIIICSFNKLGIKYSIKTREQKILTQPYLCVVYKYALLIQKRLEG